MRKPKKREVDWSEGKSAVLFTIHWSQPVADFFVSSPPPLLHLTNLEEKGKKKETNREVKTSCPRSHFWGGKAGLQTCENWFQHSSCWSLSPNTSFEQLMKEPSFQKNGHTKLLAISIATQIPWPKFTEWSEFIKCCLTVNIKQMLLSFMKPWNLKYSIILVGDIPTWRLGTDKTLAFTGLMGTSPAVHWLKIHLLMQRTWVRSLVQKDLTYLGATTPQLLKLQCSTATETHVLWGPCDATCEACVPEACTRQQEEAPERKAHVSATRKSPHSLNWRQTSPYRRRTPGSQR